MIKEVNRSMNVKTINIAEEFSKVPYGRYFDDGANSGERFREEFLRPCFENYDKVIIELDGTRGYGSSFLDEAFGGLIRHKYISKVDLVRKLEIVTKYESYKKEIESYIEEANG